MLELLVLHKILLNKKVTIVISQQAIIVKKNVLIILLKRIIFLTFFRTEQRRSNVMTSARIQPFCRKFNNNVGCFDGFRVYPRSITKRDTALKIQNNHFCLIWKTQNISFNQVVEKELKTNFKVVDNVTSDKHVKSYDKYEYKPENFNLN